MRSKIWSLFLASVMILSCFGCQSGAESSELESSEDPYLKAYLEDSSVPDSSALPPSSSVSSKADSSSASISSKETSSQVSSKSSSSQTAPKTVRVTIPEGFTFYQIAQRLEKNGVCTAKAFYQAAQNYSPKSFSVPTDAKRAYKMEGYLFPDTYEFYVNDDPEDVLIKMLNNFNAKAGGITDKQLIVASIVEKESRSVENARLVASVIYNRLNARMKLEMDATREYVNDNITASPLLSNASRFAAVYNTYTCAALPAGPICNPGSRAVQAAMNPASSEYLYFFFGNDNQNHYSKTYEKHQAAMKQYGVQYG